MTNSQNNAETLRRSWSDETRPILTRLVVFAAFGWFLMVGAIYIEHNPRVINRIFPTKSPPTATPTEAAPPTSTPTNTPEPTATPTPTSMPTPTYTPQPVPTSTPSPTPLPPGCLDSIYLADVTVPDYTRFDQGKDFVKTWSVRNNGTCAWPDNTTLVFVRGDLLDAPTSVPIGTLNVDKKMEISVDMAAPTIGGQYTGVWRLAEGDGQPFGTILTVVIKVD